MDGVRAHLKRLIGSTKPPDSIVTIRSWNGKVASCASLATSSDRPSGVLLHDYGLRNTIDDRAKCGRNS